MVGVILRSARAPSRFARKATIDLESLGTAASTRLKRAVAAAPVVWALWVSNRLVGLRNEIGNALAQIDVQLERQYDRVFNLVGMAKKHPQHERERLEALTCTGDTARTAAHPTKQAPADGIDTAIVFAAPALTHWSTCRSPCTHALIDAREPRFVNRTASSRMLPAGQPVRRPTRRRRAGRPRSRRRRGIGGSSSGTSGVDRCDRSCLCLSMRRRPRTGGGTPCALGEPCGPATGASAFVPDGATTPQVTGGSRSRRQPLPYRQYLGLDRRHRACRSRAHWRRHHFNQFVGSAQ
jgi:hypothetical protein